MKFTILGTLTNNDLSLESKDALIKLLNSKSDNLNIDILFLNEKTKIKSISLPDNVSAKIYNGITGNDIIQKYTTLIDHYKRDNHFNYLVLALGELNEPLVPLLGERLSMMSYIDCTDIECSNDLLPVLQKPEYSGNVNSFYVLDNDSVFSFRHQKSKIMWSVALAKNKVEYINYEKYVEDKVISREYTKTTSTNLEDAVFVIVCGYGIGSKDNVEEIVEYGKKIGAVVCGTKKIIDSGWLPMNLLIGQTGHIIAPDLCITIGVSGAAPLLNGIISSKKIISINKDKDARIFNYSDYGVVGDYKEVLAEELIYNENQ